MTELKKTGEIEKIIDFVKENIDVIDDKSKILGIFEKKSQQTKIATWCGANSLEMAK